MITFGKIKMRSTLKRYQNTNKSIKRLRHTYHGRLKFELEKPRDRVCGDED